MEYNFKRHRIDKISKSEIISELKRVAKHFNFIEFRAKDFDKISSINHHTVIREFKTWNNALKYLTEVLKIELQKRHRGHYSQKELFDEMENIWNKLGHRPSINEWKALKPKISFATYLRYFNGWQNACLKFIEYKMGESVVEEIDENISNQEDNKLSIKVQKTRSIPPGLRIKILDRDNFRCVFCGRSPATDIGVKLHIDHIKPFSKGGENTFNNLQTLCQNCNLGKSNNDKIGQNII